MSYHAPIFRKSVMSGLGSMGHLSGVNDRVDEGDEVAFRFRPGASVNAAKGRDLVRRLGQLIVATNHFDAPEYQDWGGGADRGLLVVRAETRSNHYTLQQLANFMPSIAAKAARGIGHAVTFVSASNEDNDEAFAQAPGGGGSNTVNTGPLRGLTGDQVTQHTSISTLVDRNLRDVARIFGTQSPGYSFDEICRFNFRSIVHSSAGVALLRALMLYANAQNVKVLAALPSLMRGKNDGSQQAAALLEKSLRELRESNDNIATVCARFAQYLPAMSGLAGGGLGVGPVVAGGIIAGLTAGQITAIVVGGLAAIVTIWLLIVALRSNEEATLRWCKAREEATGVKCTPEDFEEQFRRQPPDARAALNNALNKMGEAASSAVKILLIGASVLGLGYIGYKLFSGTKAMQGLGEKASAAGRKMKTSVSAVRESVRARMGGGGSSSRRLTASSESFNT
jgi:hypothetical protein